jgi:NhaA family Na+:H+ antiporter
VYRAHPYEQRTQKPATRVPGKSSRSIFRVYTRPENLEYFSAGRDTHRIVVGLAIVDDVGAIFVIAFFYTQDISLIYLSASVALILLLGIGNYGGIRQPLFYSIIGIAAWWAMLRSGVHPTVAGVAIALTIPARPRIASGQLLDKERSIIAAMREKPAVFDALGSRRDHQYVKDVHDLAERAGTPLRRWEDAITLPVSLFILPLFALANAGFRHRLHDVDIHRRTGFRHPT